MVSEVKNRKTLRYQLNRKNPGFWDFGNLGVRQSPTSYPESTGRRGLLLSNCHFSDSTLKKSLLVGNVYLEIT